MPTQTALLSSRAVLALEGPDRYGFLQGLTSNDVNLAQDGKALFTCLLTPQGKFDFDLIIKPEGEQLFISCEAARRADLEKRLKQFTLRATITLIQTSHKVYAAWGGTWSDSFFADPRLPQLGGLAFSEKKLPASTTEADYTDHRYGLGVAQGSAEIAVGNATLFDANFDLLNGVSFSKGCYMGQELTARMHHRALIKKRTLPFAFTGPAPSLKQLITLDTVELGAVLGTAKTHGLGLFNLERVTPNLEKPIVVGDTQIKVYLPEYFSI